MNKKQFYERIKDVLTYTGIALAVIAGIAYLIIIYILVFGFNIHYNREQLVAFLLLGGAVGVLINIAMRIQGIDFAKLTPTAKQVMEELTKLSGISDDVKIRPMWVMFVTTILKDIIVKGGTIGLSLYFVIDISYQGLGEEKYFYLAFANLLLYFGLGLLSMSKAYDYYLESHIPYMKQKIKKLELNNKKERIDEDERVDIGVRTTNQSD